MRISLAIITFNEQDNVIPLLNNVYDQFDEITIVDGCSTDKTIKFIEDFRTVNSDTKIHLFIQPQNGPRYSKLWHQGVQRNLLIKRCTGDWIFTMDADERLDADGRAQLEVLLVQKPSCVAWAMPTRQYWDVPTQIRVDKFWWPNYHYRFWRNGLGIRYSHHHRHCFPYIPQYPDVRRILNVKEGSPYSNVIIHHYHHCPIKKSGLIYRSNSADVRTVQELEKGIMLKEVEPRTKIERELKWESEHS